MAEHITNGTRQHPVLQKLHPLMELTSVIRPHLLLAASVADVGPILLALLYHREKDAFQSRLRFRLPGQPEFLRRTKWRVFSGPARLHRHRESILRDFTDLVTKVGGANISQVDFPPDAGDEEILHLLLSSPVPSFLS